MLLAQVEIARREKPFSSRANYDKMILKDAVALLDEALPDDLIRKAVARIFQKCEPVAGHVHVEFEVEDVPAGYAPVPLDAEIGIVMKSFLVVRLGPNFATFEAQVAIGGLVGSQEKLLRARYCFATLFFNENRECFTADFHVEAR
jgi:hypothetical protein